MLGHSRLRKSELSSVNQVRKKLYSLRLLNPKHITVRDLRDNDKQFFNKLEKSLEKDNRQQESTVDITPLPLDDEKRLDESRFWKEFVSQTQKITNKVQHQRVNFYQKKFIKMKKQFNKEQDLRKKSIQGLEGSIRQKYRQVHSLFEEIRQQRAVTMFNTTVTKGRKGKKSEGILMLDNSSKVNTLKQTIDSLRQQVAQIEKDMQILIKQHTVVKNQWIYFIRKMLKQNYYLKKGSIPLLEELIALKYNPKISDMPNCLDEISIKCLLLETQKLKNISKNLQMPKRVYSQSNSKIAGIAKRELIRDIYKDTKQYMTDLVKQSIWTEKLKLPPLKLLTKPNQANDWRQNQKKRLSHVYTGELYDKIRSIMFGPKVQTKN